LPTPTRLTSGAEPLIVRGGRKRTRWEEKVRDWVAERITMKKNCPGAKPRDFHDLFPGSGMVGDAWREYQRQPRLPLTEERPRGKNDPSPLLDSLPA
jgi:hypothetical protein